MKEPRTEPERTGGFIALHRKLLENPLTTQLSAAWFRVFVVILLKVNWKPGKWWNGRENVTIPPGSMVTSVAKLSQWSGATAREIRGLLSHLQATNTATIQTTSRYTTISLTHWAHYQNQLASDDKPEVNQATKSRQRDDKAGATIEEVNQGTSKEGYKNASDRRRDFPSKNGETIDSKPERFGPQTAPDNQGDHECEALRVALARHFGQVIGPMEQLLTPDDDLLNRVLEALGTRTVPEFIHHLNSLPARFKAGGKMAPQRWGWFISTARNLAGSKDDTASGGKDAA